MSLPSRGLAYIVVAGACWQQPDGEAQNGTRLTARPGTPTQTVAAGTTTVSDGALSAVLYVPAGVTRDRPAPLVVFLHGANRVVDHFVDVHKSAADSADVIVLAPYARAGTWDAIRGGFGPDPAIIDAALRWTFERWSIDPARIVLSGFSDGATYALALGRANGDLFSKVVAYSPGFLIDVAAKGTPSILITHGRADAILPIDATSRVIVPALRGIGYSVDYREFDGPHRVPQGVLHELIRGLGGSSD